MVSCLVDQAYSVGPPESDLDHQLFRAGEPAVHCSEEFISNHESILVELLVFVQ